MKKRGSAWLFTISAVLVGCATTGSGELSPLGDDHSPPGNSNGPSGNPKSPGANPNSPPGGGSVTCASVCGDLVTKCQYPVDCAEVCAESVPQSVLSCVAAAGCDLDAIEKCDGGEGGSGGSGGFGGSGGSGGFGGGDGGFGGGDGGTGGGGPDCFSVCSNKEMECDTSLGCSGFCDGASSNDVICLQGISCALTYTCGATGTGGTGGGTGGIGGSGGFGGSGTCTAPDCMGCPDACSDCLCFFNNDPSLCTSECG